MANIYLLLLLSYLKLNSFLFFFLCRLNYTGRKTIRPIIYSGQNNNDLRDVNYNLNLLHTSVCFKLRKPVLNLATSCSKSLRHLSSLRENLKNACNIKKYNEMLLVIVINRILALFLSIVFSSFKTIYNQSKLLLQWCSIQCLSVNKIDSKINRAIGFVKDM